MIPSYDVWQDAIGIREAFVWPMIFVSFSIGLLVRKGTHGVTKNYTTLEAVLDVPDMCFETDLMNLDSLIAEPSPFNKASVIEIPTTVTYCHSTVF